MKIWVKFVYGCIKLQKKPPSPFAKSWQRAWIKKGSEKKFTLFTFEDPILLVWLIISFRLKQDSYINSST